MFKSPYAWSKFGGEELCRLYSKIYDLNTTICRFYNVYGKRHIRTGSYATVLGIFAHQFLNNVPITVIAEDDIIEFKTDTNGYYSFQQKFREVL